MQKTEKTNTLKRKTRIRKKDMIIEFIFIEPIMIEQPKQTYLIIFETTVTTNFNDMMNDYVIQQTTFDIQEE